MGNNLSFGNFDRSPLMDACIHKKEDMALKLIESGNSKPDYVNNDGYTALIYACMNRMEKVAIKLIETGNSKPEQYDKKYLYTALIWSCVKNMPNVALKLIETGNSKPETVNRWYSTALMQACANKMEEVAIKLIETGNSKPENVDKSNYTAFRVAFNEDLSESFLCKYISQPEISAKFINEHTNLLVNILKKNYIELFKMMLMIDVDFSAINELYLIDYLEKNKDKINFEIKNEYVVKLLCKYNKEYLIKN
jgi:ankyrin repeat protein